MDIRRVIQQNHTPILLLLAVVVVLGLMGVQSFRFIVGLGALALGFVISLPVIAVDTLGAINTYYLGELPLLPKAYPDTVIQYSSYSPAERFATIMGNVLLVGVAVWIVTLIVRRVRRPHVLPRQTDSE